MKIILILLMMKGLAATIFSHAGRHKVSLHQHLVDGSNSHIIPKARLLALPMKLPVKFLSKSIDSKTNINVLHSNFREKSERFHEQSSFEIVKTLNEQPLNEVDSAGQITLIWAILQAPQSYALQLIDKGASVNFVSPLNHETPLILAVTKGRNRIVAKLVEAGANIDAIDYKQQTALMIAASFHDDSSLLEILLSRKSNLDAVNWRGYSSLAIAVMFGSDQSVKSLIAHGANINFTVKKGPALSILMLAIEFQRWSIVSDLLRNEVDVNYSTEDGHTALWLDQSSRNQEVAKDLISHGAR